MPQKMRVSNCHEYNKFLQERGSIFCYINDAIENWYENCPKMQGGNYIYSDKVVILVHIIVSFFRIGLRQTSRVYKRVFATNRKRFAAIHKHQKKLNIKINDCRK
ncbi:transposase [Wolbachia endosymbiont (group B) of Ablattaria laevigata]|uniref:transposase n=1 Tax=unclassified Wolbachia TaxID=2640676 RepID=UPI00376ED6EB